MATICKHAPYISAVVRSRLLALTTQHSTMELRLGDSGLSVDETVQLRKELHALAPIVEVTGRMMELERHLDDVIAVESDVGQDEELKVSLAGEWGEGVACIVTRVFAVQALAVAEKTELLEQVGDLEHQVVKLLLPKEEGDESTELVLEVRAGTGGTEAQIFAQEIFEMYEKVAGLRGWGFRVVSVSEGDGTVTGFREAVAIVSGDDAYHDLRFEGGVHRVQRVPLTDKTRIHTSTATVAVLPTPPDDVQVPISDSELEIDTYRARGAGGQHVNTTDSAIRITHVPTGIVVTCQDDRSQHKNRAQAMKLLQAKVHAKRQAELDKERVNSRRSMIGSGERSERIRTYNFPQDRITDHRIHHTETGMESMMSGALLESFTERLLDAHIKEQLDAVCTSAVARKT